MMHRILIQRLWARLVPGKDRIVRTGYAPWRKIAAVGWRSAGLTTVIWACCAVPATLAAGATSPGLTVSNPWMRALPGPTPAAAYFTVSNASSRPRVLVGVSSPDCGALMMHESRNVKGVESMAMVAQRVVPPHGRIAFAPGGYHLMCMSPSKAVRPGRQIRIILRFADGQRLPVRFAVRPLGG